MNDQTPSNQTCITRAAFQDLLHQALVAVDGMCCGLLAAARQEPFMIRRIVLVKESDYQEVITKWAEAELVCAGLFHLENRGCPDEMLSVMPEVYVELVVCLDEKGRLDLLAYQHAADRKKTDELPLLLIEDGQHEVDE